MQEEVLTPLFGIILLVLAYVALIYLKTFLVHLYSSQITSRKNKMDNKILFLSKMVNVSLNWTKIDLVSKSVGILSSMGMMPLQKKKL